MKLIAILLTVTIFAGCQTPHTFHSSQKVGDGIYQVTAAGNGFTPYLEVLRTAKKHGNDVCFKHGYEEFEVTDKDVITSSETIGLSLIQKHIVYLTVECS